MARPRKLWQDFTIENRGGSDYRVASASGEFVGIIRKAPGNTIVSTTWFFEPDGDWSTRRYRRRHTDTLREAKEVAIAWLKRNWD